MRLLEGAAAFNSDLVMKKVGKRTWSIVDDLVFYSAKYRGIVIAPAGMQTNLASIPRISWTIFPPIGWYDLAAVIHDGGYSNSLVTKDGRRIFTVKKVADDLFLEGMLAMDVNAVVACIMYSAVVIGGSPDGHPLAKNARRQYADDFVLLPDTTLP
jgi:hypothetical protein